jgi:hypothetical protein
LHFSQISLKLNKCNKEEFPYWDLTLNVDEINKDENNVLDLNVLFEMKIIKRENKKQNESFL